MGRLLRPAGPLPRPGWRALALDALLAFALGLAVFEAATDPGDMPGPRPLPGSIFDVPRGVAAVTPVNDSFGAAMLVFVVCVPLALRRRYPLGVLWTVLAGVILVLLRRETAEQPKLYIAVVVACLVAAYSAAAHSPYRLPALASMPVVAIVLIGFRALVVTVLPERYLPFLILAPLVAAAGGYHVWRMRAGEDRKLVAEQERRQAEALRHAASGERARIARELHDVVTHHVSVMVVQAGAARTVLATSPDDARDALLAVESTGRTALTELRHVMGLLAPSPAEQVVIAQEPPPRPGTPTLAELIGPADRPAAAPAAVPVADDELSPQPGLDRLPALVGRLRDAGVAVTLAESGQRRPVPAGVELTAYRVVQEALTNTMRHAAGAAAAVTVEYAEDRLRIEVTDTGGRPVPGAGPGGGRGLVGLGQRLAVYGGTLRAGGAGGGYRVEALIPLEPA